MHKKAMEMAKHAMEDACAKGYDCMTSQDWDNFKDCVETAEKMIKAEYYYLIVEEMKEYKEEEEAEEKHVIKMLKEKHGMSDDESRRYYDEWRYANGRFAPKGRGMRRGYEEPPYYHMMPDMNMSEWNRDMDRMDGRMYYPTVHSDSMPMHSDSRYENAKRGYSESKRMNKGDTPEENKENMRKLEEIIDTVKEDLKEYIPHMTASEKAMAKQKVDGICKMIMQ